MSSSTRVGMAGLASAAMVFGLLAVGSGAATTGAAASPMADRSEIIVDRQVRIVIKARPPAARRGTVLVTRGVDGQPGNNESESPMVSAAGSTVVFSSSATNLVRRRLGQGGHLFAWDDASRRTDLVSIMPNGTAVWGYAVDVSADGRRVLFKTGNDLWLRDRKRRTTVSAPADSQLDTKGRLVTYPTPDDGWSYTDAASSDGRFVVMERATEPSGYDWEVPHQIWDQQTHRVARSFTLDRNTDGGNHPEKLSANGRYLVVGYAGAHGDHSAWVKDLAEQREFDSDGHDMDVSDDSRWLLRVGHGKPSVKLSRIAGGRGPELLPGTPRSRRYTEYAVDGASMSADGSAVAYDILADLLLPRVRTTKRQVYYWRKGG